MPNFDRKASNRYNYIKEEFTLSRDLFDMKSYLLTRVKKILLISFVLSGTATLFLYASNTIVNMEITRGTVTISSPSSFTFSTSLTLSYDAQTLEQEFTGGANNFVVLDMKGSDTGYSTTLQLSGAMTTVNANTVAATNVYFKSSSGNVNLLSGTANPRVVIDANTASFQALDTAKTFIYRNNAANSDVVGKYGQTIFLRIIVPAYQAPGSYAGTLVYTLIEN